MGWINFLVVLVILILIGLITIKITVEYKTEPTVYVGFLFFKFKVVPGKKKKVKTSKYKIKSYRKMRLKERAAARAKARKAAEKKAAKKAKAEAKKAKKAQEQKEGKVKKKSLRQTIADLKGKVDFGLDVAKGVLGPLVRRFAGRLRVDIYNLVITVATGDAAKTAQTYGLCCIAVADLFELLSHTKLLTYKNDCRVQVIPDFVSDKIEIDLKIVARIRLWHILAVPFGAIGDFLKVLIKR